MILKITIISIFCFALVQCTSQQKIVYKFPIAIAPEIKKDYEIQCKKGYILYQINCAKCHTKNINGKNIIPDFTIEKISAYEIRVANASHSDSLTDERITAEELGIISTFFTYKARNSSKDSLKLLNKK